MSFRIFYPTLFTILLFVACEKKTEEKKEVIRTEDPTIPLDTMGEWVKLVMKQKEGVLRGFEIGDNIDSIKIKEKAKIHEDNKEKKYITYTFDVDEDFVDITYFYNDAQKLKAIQVSAVVNGVESFLEDFTKFYDLRYGVGKKLNDTMQVWKAIKGYQIKLAKSSKESRASILIE
ncbi:MAG: hypothetical protein ACK40K_02600 [Raineya sp.]